MNSTNRPVALHRRQLLLGAAGAATQLALPWGSKGARPAATNVFDFSGETVGAEPASFAAIVGGTVKANQYRRFSASNLAERVDDS